MNHEYCRHKTFIMIPGEDRYVCLVEISNVGDLLLGPASSSYELSYFGLLYPSTKELRALG